MFSRRAARVLTEALSKEPNKRRFLKESERVRWRESERERERGRERERECERERSRERERERAREREMDCSDVCLFVCLLV